jgi:hypothetical protein
LQLLFLPSLLQLLLLLLLLLLTNLSSRPVSEVLEISTTRLKNDVHQRERSSRLASSPSPAWKPITFAPQPARRRPTLLAGDSSTESQASIPASFSATNIPGSHPAVCSLQPAINVFPAGGFAGLLSLAFYIVVAAHTWLELNLTYSHIHRL